jgi:hypothetical protein
MVHEFAKCSRQKDANQCQEADLRCLIGQKVRVEASESLSCLAVRSDHRRSFTSTTSMDQHLRTEDAVVELHCQN